MLCLIQLNKLQRQQWFGLNWQGMRVGHHSRMEKAIWHIFNSCLYMLQWGGKQLMDSYSYIKAVKFYTFMAECESARGLSWPVLASNQRWHHLTTGAPSQESSASSATASPLPERNFRIQGRVLQINFQNYWPLSPCSCLQDGISFYCLSLPP